MASWYFRARINQSIPADVAAAGTRAAARKARAIDRERSSVHTVCGAAMALRVEYDEAERALEHEIVSGPSHAVKCYYLGLSQLMRGLPGEVNSAICTLSLSFNNDGPLGTFFRYIGDSATYLARYDDLLQSTSDGKDEKIDVSQVAVSMNGIELQDREFFAAIREGRDPNSSVAQVFNCYQVLHDLEQQLA